MRPHRTTMCNGTSENLEVTGSALAGCSGTTVSILRLLRSCLEFEGPKVEFLGCVAGGVRGRGLDQSEHRVRELLPDREIRGRNREPAEPEHVAPRFGDVP